MNLTQMGVEISSPCEPASHPFPSSNNRNMACHDSRGKIGGEAGRGAEERGGGGGQARRVSLGERGKHGGKGEQGSIRFRDGPATATNNHARLSAEPEQATQGEHGRGGLPLQTTQTLHATLLES